MTVLCVMAIPTVMAQCSGSKYVPPTTTDCDCVGVGCDPGGDQINGHDICDSVASGGTNCVSHDAVIGVTKTCSTHVDYWALAKCLLEAGGCALVCEVNPGPACWTCIAETGIDTAGGGACMICDNIVTCSETDEDIHGQVYESTSGTCPTSG